jgi:sigma-B regulation protein RsbU (phosphoserine phosphatase)
LPPRTVKRQAAPLAASPCAGEAGGAYGEDRFSPFSVFLISDRADLAESLRNRVDPRWATIIQADAGSVPEAMGADVVLVDVSPEDPAAIDRAMALAARLCQTAVPVLALDGHLAPKDRVALYRSGVLAFVPPDEGAEEFCARIESLLSSKRPTSPAVRRLREHTRVLDEQLRLAQRLQMDFLPRRLPAIAGARMAARLEPVSWVSGDFYDVFRLDEKHIGFYIADAVGHGIPAALLTVFVKKSLQTKRIEGSHYELIPPDEALHLLNLDLLSAELRESPFITMVYCLYNIETHELAYARGGHPRPLLLDPDGSIEPLDGDGTLMGVFPEAAFDMHTRRLEPGQRLLIYSDGAEHVEPIAMANPRRLLDIIRTIALLPLETMLDGILDAVHGATCGNRLADDVTLVGLEIETPREG